MKIRDPLNMTLAGMPELDLFPNDAARQRAFSELSERPNRPKVMVLSAIAGVAVMFAVGWVTQWVLTALAVPRAVFGIALGIVLMLTLVFMVRTVHRRTMAPELRLKLLEAGIAVCVKCGYALHGLPTDTTRCPECGRELDDRARELIRP